MSGDSPRPTRSSSRKASTACASGALATGRGPQQSLRRGLRLGAGSFPSQHGSELPGALLVIQATGDRKRAPRLDALADQDVRIRVGRDLGHVTDAQDLVMLGEGTQPLPQGRGVPAADPGIDLVEDEERRLVSRRKHDLQREREAARPRRPTRCVPARVAARRGLARR